MSKKQSLLETHPDLCEEWDCRKNQLLGLQLEKLTVGSHKKAWWKCSEGHSWSSLVYNRTIGSRGCPYCSNNKVGYGNDLLTKHLELCEQWDYEKNKLGPENYLPGSKKKVWWKCSSGHLWEAVIKSRVGKGNGCPYCSNQKVGYGNDLLTNHPELCEEWDFEKNKLGPENYAPSSRKKVWWRCFKGHSWKTCISNRNSTNNTTGCPFCMNRKLGYGNDFLTNYSKLCEEWDYDKNKLGPENFFPGSLKKVWWRCLQEHSWLCSVNNRTSKLSGCPKCSVGNISRISQKWLDSLGVEQREVQIGRFRVDGFDPETNTVYEFLGDYWHGNPKIFSAGKNAHNNKSFRNLYLETKERIFRLQKMGYKVIYIWESEYIKNK